MPTTVHTAPLTMMINGNRVPFSPQVLSDSVICQDGRTIEEKLDTSFGVADTTHNGFMSS